MHISSQTLILSYIIHKLPFNIGAYKKKHKSIWNHLSKNRIPIIILEMGSQSSMSSIALAPDLHQSASSLE